MASDKALMAIKKKEILLKLHALEKLKKAKAAPNEVDELQLLKEILEKNQKLKASVVNIIESYLKK